MNMTGAQFIGDSFIKPRTLEETPVTSIEAKLIMALRAATYAKSSAAQVSRAKSALVKKLIEVIDNDGA